MIFPASEGLPDKFNNSQMPPDAEHDISIFVSNMSKTKAKFGAIEGLLSGKIEEFAMENAHDFGHGSQGKV